MTQDDLIELAARIHEARTSEGPEVEAGLARAERLAFRLVAQSGPLPEGADMPAAARAPSPQQPSRRSASILWGVMARPLAACCLRPSRARRPCGFDNIDGIGSCDWVKPAAEAWASP